jgi:hypothetical protein
MVAAQIHKVADRSCSFYNNLQLLFDSSNDKGKRLSRLTCATNKKQMGF